ncbi:MAG TPA: type II secretion system major pseudopilin GspG [Pseudomonadales bacterium]|nr:type II secretion system major pseudopilin GspG [Pseudomonadales bacterium]
MKNVVRKAQTGFTMIEIMVVVAILGILAAMVVPSIIGKDDQARVARAKSDIKAISSALDMYKLDNYKYPTTEQGLEALVNKPENAKNWPEGGYLKKVPTDPWENPFVYVSPAEGAPYEIISYGSDGQEGGEGYAADISSKNL